MKILAIADTHISEHHSLGGGNRRGQDGLRLSLLECRGALEWVEEIIRREDPAALVHCGDVFDRGNPTIGEQYVAARFFERLEIPTIVVIGNHDQGYASSIGLHGLSPMPSDSWKHFAVIDSPTSFNLTGKVVNVTGRAMRTGGERDSVRVYALPYPDRSSFVSSGTRHDKNAELSRGLDVILSDMANDAARHHGPTVLVSHVTFAGSSYDSGQPVAHHDVKVPTDRLADFDFVIAGHLHKRQRIGGFDHAWYIGPPLRWSFNDEDNPAGAALIDTETGSFEFLEYESAPIFVTLSADDVDAAEPNSRPGVFARVVGEVETDTRYDEVEDQIERLAPSYESVRNDVTLRKHSESVDGLEAETDIDLFDHYLESRPGAIPEEDVEPTRDIVRRILESA